MRRLALLCPLLLAAAPVPAQFAADPYKALGTEPFWTVTIADGSLRLDEPGQRPVVVAAPVPRPTFNGRRYETRALTVDVTRTPCSDGMSDRRYPDSVTVSVGRRVLRGCGGQPSGGEVVPLRLADTRWTIEAVDGARIQPSRPTEIGFADDRVAGSAGCNRFGGSYALRGDRLAISALFSTRMACDAAAMRIEGRVIGLLERSPRVSRPGRDTLVLSGAGGSLLLRRIR